MGLPLVIGASLVGILRLDVINGGQVAVAAIVINREGGALVVGGRVGAAEGFGDHAGIGRKVQSQLHLGCLFGFARGLLRNRQHHALVHVGAAGTVNRGRHQTLPGGVDDVELFVQHEGAVAGKNFLQTVSRAHREEAVASDSQVERVGRERNIALTKLLAHLLERDALADRAGSFLQWRSGKNIAKVSARTLEAGGADVGDVIAGHAQHGGSSIQAGQGGIERHGSGLLG